jgi:hypothetical protein
MFIFWALVAFLSLFLISSAALSKGKDKERPAGWDKGEKALTE